MARQILRPVPARACDSQPLQQHHRSKAECTPRNIPVCKCSRINVRSERARRRTNRCTQRAIWSGASCPLHASCSLRSVCQLGQQASWAPAITPSARPGDRSRCPWLCRAAPAANPPSARPCCRTRWGWWCSPTWLMCKTSAASAALAKCRPWQRQAILKGVADERLWTEDQGVGCAGH